MTEEQAVYYGKRLKVLDDQVVGVARISQDGEWCVLRALGTHLVALSNQAHASFILEALARLDPAVNVEVEAALVETLNERDSVEVINTLDMPVFWL